LSARRRALSPWQKHLLCELRTIAATHPEAVRITTPHPCVTSGIASVTIELPTADIPTAPGGLRLRDVEEFVIDIDTYPFVPPAVHVTHLRFAEFPHVLVGHHLCVYLDPAREWHPAAGMVGLLERLWQWLTDAAQNRFDPAEALYHPVGGILHASPGAPTIVVRELLPKCPALLRMWIRTRTPARLDISTTASADSLPALAINLSNALPFSAGNHLHQLLALIDKPRLGTAFGDMRDRGWPRPDAVLGALAATAARTSADQPVYFLLAAPLGGGESAHLLCGRLTPDTAAVLRTQLRRSPTAPINIVDLPSLTPIEWCSMSDERPDITTRRDQRRPVTGLRSRNVHVWGCGGLGSWIAELVVRAGAEHVTVCDPGTVNGGILVRQNYTEEDIGMNKAEALARRLRTVSDLVEVTAITGRVPDDAAASVTTADVLIDATVSIAVAGHIEALASTLGDDRRCLLAQVATDVTTSTLGLMTVAAPGSADRLAALDAAAAAMVASDVALEPFRVFWREPGSGDELTPVRGCSIPTFHGSAADLFALAATFTNLIGAQLDSPISGMHLIATPQSGHTGPGHRFIPNLLTTTSSGGS
jgi:molybdopterin/thiamine biosynthesis adenylyltransferase